jgi:hypothetical protein
MSGTRRGNDVDMSQPQPTARREDRRDVARRILRDPHLFSRSAVAWATKVTAEAAQDGGGGTPTSSA